MYWVKAFLLWLAVQRLASANKHVTEAKEHYEVYKRLTMTGKNKFDDYVNSYKELQCLCRVRKWQHIQELRYETVIRRWSNNL